MDEYDVVIVEPGVIELGKSGPRVLLRAPGVSRRLRGPVVSCETVADALREIPWAYPTSISDIKYTL